MTSPGRVPLLLRPANPPLPFVGRAVESARLATLIERGPIAVVCGFSGVGKSGLLTSVLATKFADARERTLVIDAKESIDVVGNALHRLEQLAGRASKTQAGAAQDLIEALEADALWLLVENLERIDAPLRDVLSLAQRFSRQARILCVCREDPRIAALAPHTITIGPMSSTDLRALLDEVEPGLSETEAAGIVAHAKGSPWRLRQLSMGGTVDDEGPEKSLLMLAPIAVGMLRSLTLVPSSVPLDVLARATRLPSNDVIESLARRGYLEISARGVRVHDAARSLVNALFDAEERAMRAHKLVSAIVDVGSADLGRAALGLIKETRNADALRALLDKHGDALRCDGHAAALLDVVTQLAGASDAWACRLALDVGGEALARVVVRDARDAAVLVARGELARACALAAPAAKTGAPEVRLRALDVLLQARDDDTDRALLARQGKEKLARPVDATWHAALDVAFDVGAEDADDADDAEGATSPELVRSFEGLSPLEQLDIGAIVARALRTSGDPRAAAQVLALVPASRAALSTWNGRAAEIERGHVSLALAELADARAHFAHATSFPTPIEHVEARLGTLAVHLAAGELRHFEAELAAVVAVLQEREAPPALAHAVGTLTSTFARLAGRGPTRALPALDAARKARARARDAGLVLVSLDATVVCIDAAIAAADHASVAVEAEQLAQANARVGSKRFALDARFASLVAERGDATTPLSSTALVELAQVVHENPVVARRAQALLGEAPPLDDADRAVLAALSAHTARPQVAQVVAKAAAGPEWTVDARTMHIILVDGSTVDLSHKKVLFDLLATLCANGGAATKEQLLERAWGVSDYHPLRHDNRLKVAVRKLRRLLEEILGADPIETAADGYRLRGKVRFLQ